MMNHSHIVCRGDSASLQEPVVRGELQSTVRTLNICIVITGPSVLVHEPRCVRERGEPRRSGTGRTSNEETQTKRGTVRFSKQH
jgi:hypothetical protein